MSIISLLFQSVSSHVLTRQQCLRVKTTCEAAAHAEVVGLYKCPRLVFGSHTPCTQTSTYRQVRRGGSPKKNSVQDLEALSHQHSIPKSSSLLTGDGVSGRDPESCGGGGQTGPTRPQPEGELGPGLGGLEILAFDFKLEQITYRRRCVRARPRLMGRRRTDRTNQAKA